MANGDPAIYDFTWVRGTTRPLIVRFQQGGNPLTFDDVRLTVFKGSAMAFRLSLVGTPLQVEKTDVLTGEVTFTPKAEQTRGLTETKLGELGKNRYEIELRNGAQENVYVMGVISAIGGLNDDEGDPS